MSLARSPKDVPFEIVIFSPRGLLLSNSNEKNESDFMAVFVFSILYFETNKNIWNTSI